MITVTKQQYQLNTLNTSYIMSNEGGILTHLYYGKRLPDGDHSYMAKRFRYNGNFQSNLSDNLPTLDNALLEYPAFGDGGITAPAIEILNADGTNFVDLRVTDYIIHNGKPEIEGLPASYCETGDNVKTLEIITDDSVSNIKVSLFYSVFYDYDIITRWAKITNGGAEKVTILRAYSGNIALDNDNYDLISNYGMWAGERRIERSKLLHNNTSISSNCGFSSAYANPFLILAGNNTDECSGDALGIALAYSGNHKMSADLNRYNIINLSGGIAPDNFRWNLSYGESFSTPELIMSFSSNGLNSLSQNFHSIIRDRICRGIYRDKKRPVLLNLWEACYFNFDENTIKSAANSAADVGIELLVIDDGWFGKRDNDRCSLGDWFEDKNKFPNGLNSLCDYVNSKGIKLGIWFEPEMISPDSDLYRSHPDWAMKINSRKPTETRWQLVLDLTNPDVCNYIYESIAGLLNSTNIEYIKWDCNRTMAHIGSAYLKPDSMGEYCHRYILGLYSVLEKLNKNFPNVLFEGCASGGGRFDIGMLYYSPQIWTSDNTDAVERAYIQYGTSYIYPMSCQSAHVSICPNHQTKRTVSLSARHIFALTGSFGYELDLNKVTDEDKKYIKDFIKFYNENFEVFQRGKYFRITNPLTDDYAVFEYVYKGKIIIGIMRLNTHAVNIQTKFKLSGLEDNLIYTENKSGKKYSGAELMNYGLPICSGVATDDFYTEMFELCV